MPFRKSLRYAKKRLKQVAHYIRPRAVILMYHRISDDSLEPNWLAVSLDHFVQHMTHIRDTYRPIRLPDLADAMQGNSLPPFSVVVTFDDGYRDNLLRALPILESYEVPATVFVTSGHLESQHEFWWDELHKLMLSSRTSPSTLTLTVRGREYFWETGSTERRMDAYIKLLDAIKPLPIEEKEHVLAELRAWAEMEQFLRPEYKTLTIPELKQLSMNKYIDIGGHTLTHAMLPSMTRESQEEEILEGARRLESILDRKIRTFAYPYGDFSEDAVEIVRTSGFIAACSTVDGNVQTGDDPFLLNRCAVNDWDLNVFKTNLESFFLP